MISTILAFKTVLLLVTTASLYVTITPPKVDTSSARSFNSEDKVERVILAVAESVRILLWAAGAAEVYMSWSSPTNVVVSTWSVIGAVLTLSGAVLRVRCYKLLGDRFTFELATHSRGQDTVPLPLVTSGPYAIVRHPAYVGLSAAIYGVGIHFMSPGFALTSPSIAPPQLATMVQTIIVSVAMSYTAAVPVRIRKEEKMLQSEFGEAYDRYKREVRWAVVPGVY
ncbi:hypothetical protein EXIGLDRAFT_427375 [Exidia glandulosa HHB12029]|uniref:Protein-S-isoprenylcysteine O-methyltransferase n=1 Tax=Exidia glandulosa HHB12029 TaxID=1314781 RepID=A0A165KI53_EXIGL|nr:hypothetical protein EXIGLDRAFT_427375 [Exidia glandulosa HHB12029]